MDHGKKKKQLLKVFRNLYNQISQKAIEHSVLLTNYTDI